MERKRILKNKSKIFSLVGLDILIHHRRLVDFFSARTDVRG
jgi:hypothetical protein